MAIENEPTLIMPRLLLGIPNVVGGEEMIKVEDIEAIRRAYFIEGLSMRAIARKLHHGRRLVKKAIADAGPYQYQLKKPRAAPILGPYQDRINELPVESEQQPRKQRYTARRIYKPIRAGGYQGSESTKGGRANARTTKIRPMMGRWIRAENFVAWASPTVIPVRARCRHEGMRRKRQAQ